MPDRRRTTTPLPRVTANELSKSIELEQRVARLEIDVRELRGMVEAFAARLAAQQAQLDHASAKLHLI